MTILPKINFMNLLPLFLTSLMLFSCGDDKAKPSAETTVEAATSPSATEIAKRAEIVAYAKEYLGTAYCYASSDPKKGFDCSGFVNFVYKNFGIVLPRSSTGFENVGKKVKPEDFQVGDILVFYGYQDSGNIGHVGIICEANGMKSKFIHSSSGKEMAVIISELGSAGYTKRYYKCVDVLSGT